MSNDKKAKTNKNNQVVTSRFPEIGSWLVSDTITLNLCMIKVTLDQKTKF